MKTILVISFNILAALVLISCNPEKQAKNTQHMSPETKELSAKDILGFQTTLLYPMVDIER